MKYILLYIGAPLAFLMLVKVVWKMRVQALIFVFEKLKTLEEVVMRQNSKYYSTVKIVQRLSTNLNSRVLNLNDNTIELKGVDALVEILSIFRDLKNLNIY